MSETPQLSFRITLWRPWLLALAPLAVLAAAGGALAIRAGRPAAALPILLLFAVLAIVLLALIGLVVRTSRWDVGSGGIGGRNNQLRYRWLAWSEIESVEAWLIPGYPYLQVNGRGARWAFWLPLFLVDMPRFRSAVAQYAPPDNPLRRYLDQH